MNSYTLKVNFIVTKAVTVLQSENCFLSVVTSFSVIFVLAKPFANCTTLSLCQSILLRFLWKRDSWSHDIINDMLQTVWGQYLYFLTGTRLWSGTCFCYWENWKKDQGMQCQVLCSCKRLYALQTYDTWLMWNNVIFIYPQCESILICQYKNKDNLKTWS